MLQITIGQLLDAIEKNGLVKIKGHYLDYKIEEREGEVYIDYDTPVAGCAFGQGAINLNVSADALCDLYYKWAQDQFDVNYALGHKLPRNIDIVALNDETDMTLKEIADTAREALKDHLDIVLESEYLSPDA